MILQNTALNFFFFLPLIFCDHLLDYMEFVFQLWLKIIVSGYVYINPNVGFYHFLLLNNNNLHTHTYIYY